VDLICTAIAVGARMEWGMELCSLWMRSWGATAMVNKCSLPIGGCRQTRSYCAKGPLGMPWNWCCENGIG